MISLLAIGMIAGIILGLRFRVLVLVPATLFAAGVVAVVGLAGGQLGAVIALTMAGTAALLQVGYLVGCVLEVANPVRLPKRTTAGYTHPDTKPI